MPGAGAVHYISTSQRRPLGDGRPSSIALASKLFGFSTLRSGRESLCSRRARMILDIIQHGTLDELMLSGIRLKTPQGGRRKDDFPRASIAILASKLSHNLFRSA